MILLSSAYFPNLEYCAQLLEHNEVIIEQHEHFIKQTYRNRAVILAANGSVPLIVPVVKGRGPKTAMKDLRISYDEDWQRNHWRTIFSAYNSSPFLEFYADDLQQFFSKKYDFLLDLNMEILDKICELLEISPKFSFTEEFEQIPEGCVNYRENISPKNAGNSNFMNIEYTQVFSDKLGFSPNLSILDLLFNTGPQSWSLLDDGRKK